MNFKDYIANDIEEKKTILSVIPNNTQVRKKKLLETIRQIKEDYLKNRDNVIKFINYYYDKLSPVKVEKDDSYLVKEINFLKSLLTLGNPSTTYFEKMQFDQLIYSLMHYYNYSIKQINEILNSFFDKFEEAGITLTKNDFKLNVHSYLYMSYFFDEYLIINGNYVNEHFERVYWKCPNVFLYLVVNFRMILKKYERKLERYVNLKYSKTLKDNNYSNYTDVINRLKVVYDEYRNIYDEDEYDIVQLCLEQKLDISYYSSDNKSILSDYDFFLIHPIDLENEYEKNHFIDSLIDLRFNLEEYQFYLKYSSLIDFLKNKYKDKVKSTLKNKDSSITSLQKEISKIEKQLLWKTRVNKYCLTLDELDSVLSVKDNDILFLQDSLLKNVYELYKKYNTLYYENKIQGLLSLNSKVSDILEIVVSFPLFMKGLIKDVLELESDEEVDSVIDEIKEIIYHPHRKIIDMIPLFQDNNIPQILMNGFRFENLNIIEDSFDDTNIKIIFERSDKIIRELKIRKFKLGISEIQFLVSVYNMRKEQDV